MLHSYIWENCLIWESVAYNNITQIFLYGSASFTVLHFLIYICGPLFCFGYLISFKVYFRSISLMYSGTLWHVQKCFWYIITKFTPSIILLYLPSLLLKMVSSGLIVPFSQMSNNGSTNVHSPSPFPYFLHPAPGIKPQTKPVLPSFIFEGRHFVFYYKLYRELYCDICKHMGIMTRIGSSPPFFSFLP
jgi:hypothetical protein